METVLFGLLSSIFTGALLLPCSPIERGVGHVFTEADWSIVPSETVLSYFYSKREAEKRAWAIAEEQSRQVP